ncbi:MAG: RNase P subunit p30 family protein [Candidatus Hodarchaeales archaeon]
MKRKFIDIAVQFNQYDHFQEICEMVSELGYYGICVEGPQKQEALQNIGDLYSLKIWSRRTLEGSTSRVRAALSRERRKIHLISVHSEGSDLAKWAAKDRRVDSIAVPLPAIGKIVDSSLVKLMAANDKALEINLQEVIGAIGSRRIVLLRNLHKAIARAKQGACKIILGSGTSKITHLRAPRDMASMLQIVGLDYEESLQTISCIPLEILQKNEQRLSGDFIAPGVATIQIKEEDKFP